VEGVGKEVEWRGWGRRWSGGGGEGGGVKGVGKEVELNSTSVIAAIILMKICERNESCKEN
jgi:hypothetical protein